MADSVLLETRKDDSDIVCPVIDRCYSLYKISLNESNCELYESFVRSQFHGLPAKIRRQKDCVARNLITDKLFYFSILLRDTPISAFDGVSRTLDSDEDLKNLRVFSFSDIGIWPDKRLGRVNFNRCRARKYGCPGTIAVIDEVGMEDRIRSLWGFAVRYDLHIGRSAGVFPNDRRLNKNKFDYDGFSYFGSLLEGRSK